MEELVRELFLRIGVIIDPKAERRLVLHQRQVDELKVAYIDLREQVWAATKRMMKWTVVAAGAALIATRSLISSTTRHAEEVVRQAESLAMTRQEFQELSAVFQRYGVDQEHLVDALATLTDRSQAAQEGTKSMIDDFKLLGITVQQLKNKSPLEIFELVADGIAQAEDRGKGLSATVRLLGDDVGRRLAPMLLRGSAGINQMRQEMRDLGVILTDDQLAATTRLAKSWRELGDVIRNAKDQIGAQLAPELNKAVVGMKDWIRANREFTRGRIEDAITIFNDALNVANKAVKLVGGWDVVFLNVASGAGILLLLANIDRLNQLLMLVRFAFIGVNMAMSGMALAAGMTLGPFLFLIGGITAAIVLWALAIDDIVTFFRGGNSVLGHNLRLISQMIPFYDELKAVFMGLVHIVEALGNGVWEVTEGFLKGFSPAVDAVLEKLQPLIDKFENLKSIIDGLKLGLSTVAGTMSNMASGALTDLAASLENRAASIDARSGGVANDVQRGVASRVGTAVNNLTSSTTNNNQRSVSQNNVFNGGTTPETDDVVGALFRQAALAISGGLL